MNVLREAIEHATLGWIKPELDATLAQVRQEIEAYAEDAADPARMRMAAALLHQVQGSLKMIELYAPAMVAGARTLLAVLDWPVAQLMTLALALVGNFDAVVAAWKDAGGAALRLDTGFLGAAARASVRGEIAQEAEEFAEAGVAPGAALVFELGPLPELRDAMSLVWRTLLVWLAVIALFVIAGWVS